MLIVLRHLLESLAPPTLLLSSHINGRFRKAAADHAAVTYPGASHSYVSAVRIGHFFSKASHHSLSGAFEHAKKSCPRRKIGKKRLKYFLVRRMPAKTKTIHLIFNADSPYVDVRIWVYTFKLGEEPVVRGWISAHNFLAPTYHIRCDSQ
jgi:hypothetical protein